MTIFSVIKEDVAIVVGRKIPTAIFTSQEREALEFVSISNVMGRYIAKSYDWKLLTTKATITGDGISTNFPMPSDFDRFTMDAKGKPSIWTPITIGPMRQIETLDEWLAIEVKSFGFLTYSWTLLGDRLQIKPALPAGGQAFFYYQSNTIVANNVGVRKKKFTADTDVFMLNEDLLAFAMIWKWRANKQQPYAEDMSEFELAKGKLIVEDKGPKSLKFGRKGERAGLQYAYPGSIIT